MGSAQFQGFTNAIGIVQTLEVAAGALPPGATFMRGMAFAPTGEVLVTQDTGQARTVMNGIAFERDTGIVILGTTEPTNISHGGLLVSATGAVVAADVPTVIHQGVGLTSEGELAVSDGAGAEFAAFEANGTGAILTLKRGQGSVTFSRAGPATVRDFEGLYRTVPANCIRYELSRIVENLCTSLITETITVKNGSDYQLTIAGDSGATAVCTGAFTGTLTANGTNRISWPNGVGEHGRQRFQPPRLLLSGHRARAG